MRPGANQHQVAGRESGDRAGLSGPVPGSCRRRSGGRARNTGVYIGLGIATNHRWLAWKDELVSQLRAAGHEGIDLGAHPFRVLVVAIET